jgi:hypothetical protein
MAGRPDSTVTWAEEGSPTGGTARFGAGQQQPQPLGRSGAPHEEAPEAGGRARGCRQGHS